MRKNNNYTDQELIQGIQKKDNQVIQCIIKDYYSMVEKLVLSNSGNKLDADETFQEALIVLYRKIREEDLVLTSSLKTYFYSVAKYRWYQELRRRRYLEDISFLDSDEHYLDIDTQEQIEKNERLKLFREKYEELSENCRKVIRMYLMNIPLKEITRIMGYSSEQIARNRRYRCKEELIGTIRETSKYKELVRL